MNARFSKCVVSVMLIAALALAIVPFAGAQEGPQPEAVGLRPDAPPYALHGPYWVGTRAFVVEDLERPLPLTVWYPALNPESLEESITYSVDLRWNPPPDITATVIGHALGDTDPDPSGAPYPLVIFSHSSGMYAVAFAHITEHLASRGFVAIAPEHAEEFYFEDFSYGDEAVSHVDRPRDIGRTLDYAATLTSSGGALEGLIDLEHVAVVGHSFGGYTALAAAGARLDMKGFIQRCKDARAAEDPNAWLCDPLEPIEDEMAAAAGIDPVPEGLWPSWGDPRVDAIIPMAGDSYLFDQAGLAEVTIPVMAMGGTADTMTPLAWGGLPTYEYVSSQQKALVVFENGKHGLFIQWEAQPWFADIFGYGFVAEPVWDVNRAHDLINHFTTAFLLATLKDDAEAAAALAPDAVAFPGIKYEAQGF